MGPRRTDPTASRPLRKRLRAPLARLVGGGDTGRVREEPAADGIEAAHKTSARLRPLEAEGWVILDPPCASRGPGHLAISPAGLYLIDTKVRFGDVAVDGDELVCHRPDKGGDDRSDIGGPLRRAGAALHQQLRELIPGAVFVHGLVAVWARFPATVAAGDQVTFVHGDRLAPWLAAQPRRLADPRVDEVVAAAQQLLAPRAA